MSLCGKGSARLLKRAADQQQQAEKEQEKARDLTLDYAGHLTLKRKINLCFPIPKIVLLSSSTLRLGELKAPSVAPGWQRHSFQQRARSLLTEIAV
jgi:hypothetical protein